MRRILGLTVVVAIAAAACGGDDEPAATAAPTTAPAATTAATTPPPTTAAPTTAAPTTAAADDQPTTTAATPPDDGDRGHPLVIAAIDFEAGFILIRNDGDSDYDLTGHWLCNRPNYTELPAEVLAPGRIVEVGTASLGIGAADGELGIYTSRDFSSAEAIVRYVEWGDSGHRRSATAVAAGVWSDGDFVDNGGANIESTGSNPVSSADWSS